MAPARVAVLAGLAAAAAACGGSAKPPPDPPKVRLQVFSPRDLAVIHEDMLEVRGTVSPARADVRVMGIPAASNGGEFDVRVPLVEGANVVDVAATASGRSPVLTALRVTRDTRVVVPAVAGQEPDVANGVLEGAGLRAKVDEQGDFLDRLLPIAWTVCQTRPAAGTKVARGTEVTVIARKDCSGSG